MAFNEEASRVNKDHEPENLAAMMQVDLSLPHQDSSAIGSFKAKRFKARCDNDYLLHILSAGVCDCPGNTSEKLGRLRLVSAAYIRSNKLFLPLNGKLSVRFRNAFRAVKLSMEPLGLVVLLQLHAKSDLPQRSLALFSQICLNASNQLWALINSQRFVVWDSRNGLILKWAISFIGLMGLTLQPREKPSQ